MLWGLEGEFKKNGVHFVLQCLPGVCKLLDFGEFLNDIFGSIIYLFIYLLSAPPQSEPLSRSIVQLPLQTPNPLERRARPIIIADE